MKQINKQFLNIWTSYVSYYFGKVNLGLVIPVLLSVFATQGFTKYHAGWITTAFFVAYALGQFINGQISERCNPYKYIAIGLIGSSIAQLFMGFYGSFFWLLAFGQVIDGLFQSMGWSSCVRATSELTNKSTKYSTYLGTSYQVGNSLAWLFASFAIGAWGWQWGFFIAAVVMTIKAIILLVYMPKDYVIKKKVDIKKQIKTTLDLPIVISGIALCLLNMVRFGIISWIPTFLYEVQKIPITTVGLKIFLIPIFGVIGTLLYNKINITKDILTMIYMLGLGIVFLIFPNTTGMVMTGLLLASGFLIYGPHVFLVTTVPTRELEKGTVAASTGFIDGMGYVGTISIGLLVPWIVDKFGWNSVFGLWSATAFVIVGLVILEYFRAKKEKLIENASN